MIALIARRELTEYLRDGRLLWAGGLIGILTLIAIAVGWQQQQAVEAERVAAQALDYDDWINQTEKHPHDAAHQGLHVFKPSPPLAIMDAGILPFVGSTIWLQAHRQSETKFRPAQDATGLQRFGNLSAAWILQVLGPLLVIVLGFNTFAGERELGTLRQTLSLGVSPYRLLWGKALALGTGAALLLLPALLVAGAATAGSVPAGERLDALLRLGGLGVGYALYFVAFVFVVLATSAWASSSRVALAALLGLWIAGVALAPRAAADLARWAHPSPTRLEFETALDAELGEVKGRMWRDTFGASTAWSPDVPLSQWGIALRLDDNAGYGVIDKHFTNLWDSFEAQQRSQELPGLLFPLLALRGYSMGLAGTDFAHHRHFATAAERHRRVMQDIMSDDLVEHADPLGDQHFTYDASRELWQRVPPFEYSLPSAATALRDNTRSLLVLLAGALLATALAHTAVGRQVPK